MNSVTHAMMQVAQRKEGIIRQRGQVLGKDFIEEGLPEQGFKG